MPIDFFDSKCKTRSNRQSFGLCDDPPPSEEPAYIDEENPEIWIGEVSNPNETEIEFYAVDKCVKIQRADGKDQSRCDGILKYSNKLIFVELKSRRSVKWFQKGRKQLTITFQAFAENYDLKEFSQIEAQVCNSLKPRAHVGQAVNIQKFMDDTGLILRGEQVIKI